MTDVLGESAGEEDHHLLVALLIKLGVALIRTGEAVDIARNQLSAIADHYGAYDVDILVFPTALMVQAGDGESALVWRSGYSCPAPLA